MNASTSIPSKYLRVFSVAVVLAVLAAIVASTVLAFAVDTSAKLDAGAVVSPTGAELRSIRDYHAFGASGVLTPMQAQSIGTYLFGTPGTLTPAQLQAVRDYHAYGASGSLTQSQARSIGTYLFATPGGR